MVKKLKEREYSTCIIILRELKKSIIGRIYFTVENNSIKFHIHGVKGITYTYMTSIDVLNLVDKYDLSKKILDTYKSYLQSKFFKY